VHRGVVVEMELWVPDMDLHRNVNTTDVKMVNLLMMVRLWLMVHMDLEMDMSKPFVMVHPELMVQVEPWVVQMDV